MIRERTASRLLFHETIDGKYDVSDLVGDPQ